MKASIAKAAVILAFLAMICVNALATILPINGLTTGAVADFYPSYFVPAGYVFSIWGLIYLALLVFTLVQALSRSLQTLVTPIRWLFVLSCIANGAWILCWHYRQLALSVGVMLVLLITLIIVYLRLRTAADNAWARWTVLAPFGVYLAWICVATIANISALLLAMGWEGAPLSGPWWAVIMMVIAAAIIARLAMTSRDALPPLVLAWAIVGIVVKFPDQMVMRVVGATIVVAMLGLSAMIRR